MVDKLTSVRSRLSRLADLFFFLTPLRSNDPEVILSSSSNTGNGDRGGLSDEKCTFFSDDVLLNVCVRPNRNGFRLFIDPPSVPAGSTSSSSRLGLLRRRTLAREALN